MTFTHLLLGSTLTLWGWHIGLWWLGLSMGILAELPRYTSTYWEFELQERQRVADLCTLLVVIAFAYLLFTQPLVGMAITSLVRWMPVLLFPLLAIQIYGGRHKIELSVLFFSLRDGRPGGEDQIDLQPFYMLICLVGAAMVQPPSTFYYAGIAGVALWALWPLRLPTANVWRWGVTILLALAIGYGVSTSLKYLQTLVVDGIGDWLYQNYFRNDNPYSTTTAIGEVGRLKLSERIVIRVWPDIPLLMEPLLLREGSFNRYVNGTWLADATPFRSLVFTTDGWVMPGIGKPQRWAKVALDLEQGRGILPVPNGSCILQGLDDAQLTSNDTGTVKAMEAPTLAQYKVGYQLSYTASPPNEGDLRVFPSEIPAVQQVVQQLGLHGLTTTQAMQKLHNLFQQDFRYSLRLKVPPPEQTALGDFLLRHRTGHCEYFASAAVLLLRQAGIPARYAIGWSIQEHSDWEQAYIARSSHAHAWALVWVNGTWQDFDPTPANWAELEAAERPLWGGLQDWWSWLRYVLANRDLNQHQAGNDNNWWLISGLVVLLGILAWRIVKRGRRVSATHSQNNNVLLTSVENLFIPIERVLSARNNGMRKPGETLRAWLLRLQYQGEPKIAELLPVLRLYYRQCFDPRGLNPQDTQRLSSLVTNWLQQSAN